MIKTFEQYTEKMIEYSMSSIDLFLKRINEEFEDDKEINIQKVNRDILEINDEDGLTYIDFFINNLYGVFDIDELLYNFFIEITGLEKWLSQNKDDKLYNIIKKIFNKLTSFINKYYSKEYHDYKKEKQIKKFKI